MFSFKRSNRPAGLPEEGRRETLDTTPINRPVGFNRPPTIQEQIRDALRQHASNLADATGAESFEEADDFDVDDDPELHSPYEVDDNLPRWQEKGQRQAALKGAEERLLETLPKPKPGAPPAPAGPETGPQTK